MTEQIIQPRKDEFQLSPAATALLTLYATIAKDQPTLAKLFDEAVADLTVIPVPSQDGGESMDTYVSLFRMGVEATIEAIEAEVVEANKPQGVIEFE